MADAKKPTAAPTTIQKSLGASLAIQSVTELMQLADILFKGGASNIAGLGRPEAVAHVILAGAEVGLSPTQALGSIMLLDGKASIYGDGALAVVRASGMLDGEVSEVVEGEGDDRRCVCKMTRRGESEKTFTFSMGEAKRAGLIDRAKGKGPWATYPDRMLKMRARGFAMRDLFSDVLRGLTTYEEASDASVIDAEVKVVGTTVNEPATATASTATASTATAPTTAQPPTTSGPQQQLAAAAPDKPITDDQKEAFKQLQPLVLASKGVGTDENARKAAWEQTLAPYGVSSIRQMTMAVAARALEEIGKAHDPFAHPAGKSSSAAA